MSKPHVVAIVQARLGGTRLPGKVLMAIVGKTLLDHHVTRLARTHNIDKIVLAVPDGKADDALADYCETKRWTVVRGPEDDVLARFHAASSEHGADVIVRTTPDCPLIDPGVVDGAIRLCLDSQTGPEPLDYVSNNLERTFPHGLDVEVFSRTALDEAHAQASNSFDREHVTEWIRRHQDAPYKLANLRYPIETAPPQYQKVLREARLTVDYPEDLAVVKIVLETWGLIQDVRAILARGRAEDVVRIQNQYPHLIDGAMSFTQAHMPTAFILWLLDKEPAIIAINRERAAEHAQLLAGAFEPISMEGRAELSDLTREAIQETKH